MYLLYFFRIFCAILILIITRRVPVYKKPHNQLLITSVYHLLQILCLTGLALSISAHVFLNRLYNVNYGNEGDDAPSAEDETVYKISYAICCFSLAVSAGSTLLLPISSISNEVLHRYPDSWYIKWLNASLIQGKSKAIV